MPKEIERKFLVSGKGWRKCADRGKAICQAYLALTDALSIRVRIIGNTKGYLTLKSAQVGITRSEFEYAIPIKEARVLLKMRIGRLIEKRRYVVKAGKARFEVDVFNGAHRGLVIAEIELDSERTQFDRPEWLGKEVTGDKQYYNAILATLAPPTRAT